MSRKMQRTIGKWLNWKTGVAVLAVLLIAAVLVQIFVGWGTIWGYLFGTAGPAGGQTCLPSCNTGPDEDGKFLSLPGEDMASFGGEKSVVWVTVPGDWGSFEIGFYDGDSGKDGAGNVNMLRGYWDDTQAECTYILYADPVRNGKGNQEITRWSDRQMPDNGWFNATISTGTNAKSPRGDYIYRLELTRPVQGHGINALKLRSNAWLSTGQADLVNASFAIVGMFANTNDRAVLYPQYRNAYSPGPSSYTGDWQFYFYVPTSTVYLEIWDGDFDRGSRNGIGSDTDDPNTSGKPAWANPFAVDEGIGGAGTGAGNPADDYAAPLWRRDPPVWYEIVDPNGQPIFQNGNPGNPLEPSGSEEWEKYLVTADTGKFPVPGTADVSTGAIIPGMYRWDIHGLDLHNTVWIRTNFQVCPDGGCPPPVWCDTECACPRTIGYWKNNFDKVITNAGGAQETRESLEWGLRNIALVSPLFRHGINYCNPVPINDPTPMTLEEANTILWRDKKAYPGCDPKTMLARALQQNLGTWMNLATSKIGYNVTTTLTGIPGGTYEGSMWDALTYAQDIILFQRGDATLLERAKDIADLINNGVLDLEPEERSCSDDLYRQQFPPDKQPPKHNDMPKQPKHPEPPAPIVGCDPPRTNQYGVEIATDNPFYGIKYNYQSGTEIRDGGFDEFRFTLPADQVNAMTSIQLEAKAGEIVGQGTLDNCQFNAFAPCERALESNGFFFTFQGAVDNGDGTMTLAFYVQNMNGFGLSHATFGLPGGVVPTNPSGNYQSEVCP